MEHVLLLLFAFLMLLPVGNGDRTSAAAEPADDILAGTDISFEEITDFYYTYDASTAPPHYQRYRFYTEGGAKYFYHETRAGERFPLTEEDITESGTRELTDEEWNEFYTLLCGGTVSNRSEDTSSGDSGPWLYLYWKNHDSFPVLFKNGLKHGFLCLLLLVVFVSIWAIADFDAFWLNFHYVFFDNDLFLLDPNTSIMINMFPSVFFMHMVFMIIIVYGLFALGAYGLAILLCRRRTA